MAQLRPKQTVSNMNKGSFLAAFVAYIVLFFSISAAHAMPEADSAQQLLKRISEASQSLSYSGTFTYEQAGSLKTFKVVHAIDDGLAHERLVYLDGPRSVVTRTSNPLSCRGSGELLLRGDVLVGGLSQARIDNHYDLQIRGEDRVADREVIELFVMPKDKFRYGYVLSVDKQTGLVLRAVLISNDRKNQVLERFQFVDLNLNPGLEADEILSGSTKQLSNAEMTPCDTSAKVVEKSDNWKVNWHPSGFVLADRKVSVEDGSESLVFTDGMAFFTVFIDQKNKLNFYPVEGHRGATVAFYANATFAKNEYAICVVGEIPMVSAKKIVSSIRPRGNS
jgi:sigma-E factor negative regulatory protein RseB